MSRFTKPPLFYSSNHPMGWNESLVNIELTSCSTVPRGSQMPSQGVWCRAALVIQLCSIQYRRVPGSAGSEGTQANTFQIEIRSRKGAYLIQQSRLLRPNGARLGMQILLICVSLHGLQVHSLTSSVFLPRQFTAMMSYPWSKVLCPHISDPIDCKPLCSLF